MNILGYASLNHDPTVALVRDGALIAAIESEKVTRAKHEINMFPEMALRAVLDQAGVQLGDIDAIATNYAPGLRANRFFIPHLWRMLCARKLDLGAILSVLVIKGAHNPRVFAQLSEARLPPIIPVKHHRAHLAFSFLSSPWDDAAVAIIDAAGEFECTSTWHCAAREVRKLVSMDVPADSLGSVYMLSTRHLGFKMLGDEYKVMGFAPYGSPNAHFRAFFERLIRLEPGGRYMVNPKLLGAVFDGGWKFPEATAAIVGAKRERGEELGQNHADFAYELQRRIEEAVLHVVRHLRKITGSRRLCLGGGVALNCVANGRVLAESGFDEVFIPPAPHDAGTAAGAALHHHYYDRKLDRPPAMSTPFLGPGFTDAEIERELVRSKQAYVTLADPAQTAAEALDAGLVIGWFQGRTEFGPRALGNRSILADPRREDMKDRVNQLIKEREGFRPFAPAVLESAAADWFETVRQSPWMLFVDRVHAHRRAAIPAVVHVDGTARPQTVSTDNALFHNLLSAFHERTGIPILLNTSFNVAGEPIVNTPVEALRCFHGSGLDALFMGSYMLKKPSVTWVDSEAKGGSL